MVNSAAVAAGSLSNKVGTMAIVVLASRGLRKEAFGSYALVLATAEIMRTVASFGVDQVSLRELARNRGNEWSTFAAAASVKLMSSTLAALLLAVFALALRFDLGMWVAVALIGADYYLSSLALSLAAMHQAHIRAGRVLPAALLGTVAGLAVGVGAYLFRAPMPLYIAAIPVGSAATILGSVKITLQTFRPATLPVSLSAARRFLVMAWPIAAMGIIVLMYFRLGTLMLSGLHGLSAVAMYAAAYKVSEAFLLVPIAVSATVLPLVSSAAMARGALDGRQVYRSSLMLVAVLALPFALLCTFESRFILVTLFGSRYSGSSEALSILGWATLLMAINMQTTATLIALGKEGLVLGVLAVNLAVNAAGNALLIPSFSYNGAAASTLVTEALNLVVQVALISRYLRPVARGAESAAQAAFRRPLGETIPPTTGSSLLD
jgi:O-antigen/teichoic acid export membrane protein